MAEYDQLRGQLLGLLIALDGRLTADQSRFGHELLDHNELGLALEMVADWLAEDGTAISKEERVSMLGLAFEMRLGDRVERTLDLCPVNDDR